MLLATKDDCLVNLRDVASVEPNHQFPGSSIATLHTGHRIELAHDLETVETMSCPVIPAQPGYTRLVHRFIATANSCECQAVIAWRLRTPYPPEPVTLQSGGQEELDCATAVEAPDNSIITMDGDRLKNRMEWFRHVAKLRDAWESMHGR